MVADRPATSETGRGWLSLRRCAVDLRVCRPGMGGWAATLSPSRFHRSWMPARPLPGPKSELAGDRCAVRRRRGAHRASKPWGPRTRVGGGKVVPAGSRSDCGPMGHGDRPAGRLDLGHVRPDHAVAASRSSEGALFQAGRLRAVRRRVDLYANWCARLPGHPFHSDPARCWVPAHR